VADADRVAPPWWLKPLNKFYMAVMGLGLGADDSMVLTVPGRTSGKPRSTPITVFCVEGRRYVLGGFPGADWVLNARAAEVATLSRGRRREQVSMVELPADEARPLLRDIPTLVPTAIIFMRNAGLVAEGRPDEFEALAGRCAVFRFDPVT
jgi:deazaflavin-dependent oxidoreductase (nitroreductase family)